MYICVEKSMQHFKLIFIIEKHGPEFKLSLLDKYGPDLQAELN